MAVEHEQSNEAPQDSPSSAPRRDLATADTSGWATGVYPAGVHRPATGVPIIVRQSVLNAIHAHGQGTTDVEVCGVLVGRACRDEFGPFIYLEGAIRGDHADGAAAQVTFTNETWNHIHEVMDNAWPDHRILAWYHTHPGFGVFLSGMDLFIHENFFGGSEQLALVYDPLGGDEAVFVWRNDQPVRGDVLIEHDAEESPPRVPGMPVGSPAVGGDVLAELRAVRRGQSLLMLAVVLLAILVMVWPIALPLLFRLLIDLFPGA